MKIAIMQPYFLPYIGYFQLIKSVDLFVLYDEVQYTKKGWINRNRFLNQNNEPEYFSLPLKKDSDYLNVNQRYLSEDFLTLNNKTLRIIENAYRKSKNFSEVYPIVENIFTYSDSTNLFDYILNSLNIIVDYLGLNTKIIKSSDFESEFSKTLKKENRVIQICKELNANTYHNPIGGIDLYNKSDFNLHGVNISFLKSDDNISYKQFNNDHVQWLSILDMLMFCSKEELSILIDKYSLI